MLYTAASLPNAKSSEQEELKGPLFQKNSQNAVMTSLGWLPWQSSPTGHTRLRQAVPATPGTLHLAALPSSKASFPLQRENPHPRMKMSRHDASFLME